jgi:hypothetical protein
MERAKNAIAAPDEAVNEPLDASSAPQLVSGPSAGITDNLEPNYSPPAQEFSSELDLFGHFDPEFDLSAVDNALEANLDIALPLMWDWVQFPALNFPIDQNE